MVLCQTLIFVGTSKLPVSQKYALGIGMYLRTAYSNGSIIGSFKSTVWSWYSSGISSGFEIGFFKFEFVEEFVSAGISSGAAGAAGMELDLSEGELILDDASHTSKLIY
mmetsp:Transcript_14940/g.19487  ORF Transcript_14940/g.19487 Transcript_14940/m.19487 type:complete len:109 (+) Transcript_14940:116-442(+)